MIFIYIYVQDINDIIAYQKTMAGAVVGGSTLRKGLLLYSPSSFYSPFWKHEQGQWIDEASSEVHLLQHHFRNLPIGKGGVEALEVIPGVLSGVPRWAPG